jgi:hypothetical protein
MLYLLVDHVNFEIKVIFLLDTSSFFNGLGLLAVKAEYGEFKAGDSFKKSDRLTFIQTENGWQLATEPKPLF